MKMSKIETAIRLVIEFNQAFNGRDVAGMLRLLSDACVFEGTYPTSTSDVFTGKEAILRYWQAYFHESPQIHMEIEEAFGLGFRCVTRWRCDWIDEKGTTRSVRGADIFQIKSGLICEKLSYMKG